MPKNMMEVDRNFARNDSEIIIVNDGEGEKEGEGNNELKVDSSIVIDNRSGLDNESKLTKELQSTRRVGFARFDTTLMDGSSIVI